MSSDDKQKYFWLKLKEDFFSTDDMKIIAKQNNGAEYIIFWQKILLKAITSKEVGILRYKDEIPYTPETLSVITDTNIDIVKGALSLFKKLGMIDINKNGDIVIDEFIQELIGFETGAATRKREYRERIAMRDAVPRLSQDCRPEIELELEKELEIEKDKDIPTQVKKTSPAMCESKHSELLEYYNKTATSLNIPLVIKVTPSRAKKLNQRLSADANFPANFRLACDKIKESDFLQGKNGGWKISFDWLINNDKNYLKVCENTYGGKKLNHAEQVFSNLQKDYVKD